MRSEGYSTWSVCVCVCVSVSSNVPSRAITCPTRDNSISVTWAVKAFFFTNALLKLIVRAFFSYRLRKHSAGRGQYFQLTDTNSLTFTAADVLSGRPL